MERIGYLVWSAVFTALIICGAYISIPLSFTPVPIVLQNLFVLLCGLLLGSRWGGASVLLYLLLGAVGLPVFAGGGGGVAHFLGPTGGYLIGFLVSVIVVGAISSLPSRASRALRSSRDTPPSSSPLPTDSYRTTTRYSLLFDIAAVAAGTVSVYLLGIPWLMHTTGLSFTIALLVGLLPFLLGDVIKATLAVVIARFIRRRHLFSM